MRRLLEWIEWVVYERELGVAAEVRVKDQVWIQVLAWDWDVRVMVSCWVERYLIRIYNLQNESRVPKFSLLVENEYSPVDYS